MLDTSEDTGVVIPTRRAVILGVTAASIFLEPTMLKAQQPIGVDRSKGAFEDAAKVRYIATYLPLEKIHDGIFEYLMTDYSARRNTLSWASHSTTFSSAESAIAYVRKIKSVLPDKYPVVFDASVQESQILVIQALEKRNLPIAPVPSDVIPFGIPTIIPDVATADSDVKVLGDIVFETLGIAVGGNSILKEFFEGDKGAQELFSELLNKVITKKWDEAVPIIENLFKLFIGGSTFRKLGEVVVRKVTFRMALGCVPIVGWVYFSAAALVSIKKNYHRFSFVSKKD